MIYLYWRGCMIGYLKKKLISWILSSSQDLGIQIVENLPVIPAKVGLTALRLGDIEFAGLNLVTKTGRYLVPLCYDETEKMWVSIKSSLINFTTKHEDMTGPRPLP